MTSRDRFLARFGRTSTEVNDPDVPRGIRIAGGWSWRLLVIAAVIAVVIFLVIQLRLLVVPVLIAVLLCGLLVPFRSFLERHGVPRWFAILIAFLSAFVVIVGLVYLVTISITSQAHQLDEQSRLAVSNLRDWLEGPPLNLTEPQIDAYLSDIGKAFQADSNLLINGALSIGSTVGHLVTGFLLTAFSTLFILIDGRGIWTWIVRIFPKRARLAVDGAGLAGWQTLQNFAKVQVLVAAIDAFGIGIGAFALQLPLVLPIAVTVFLGSFVPLVGAFVTGAIAVIIALVFKGFWFAIIMLAIVVFVQEVEGHVLQPLIMGTAVKVHPLAVVLAVAGGSLVAGIAGALFAVPFAAVANVMIRFISGGSWRRTGAAPPALAPATPVWSTVPAPRRRPK